MYSIIILIISICIILGYSRFSKAKLEKKEEELKRQNELNFEKEKEKLYNKRIKSFEESLELELKEKERQLVNSYKDKEREAAELYNRNKEVVSLRVKDLEEREKGLKKQKQLLEDLLKAKEAELDKELEKYKEVETLIIKENIKKEKAVLIKSMEEEIQQRRKEALENYEKEMNILMARKASVENECKEIENWLNEYQKKQTVINEAILRQRAIDEQQDFFKISLSDKTIHDVQILNSIKNELIDKNEIDKLIYSVYYSKPTLEMIKKVLGGKTPCGIYKITRLKTGENYIGKSSNVASRFQQHIKTACNCGTIAHSQLHTTMQKDGIENFTFELLEEVSKDKLSEREKYWINFYDSKKYGLNEKNG